MTRRKADRRTRPMRAGSFPEGTRRHWVGRSDPPGVEPYDRRSDQERRTDDVMREWVNQLVAAQRSQTPLTEEDVNSMFSNGGHHGGQNENANPPDFAGQGPGDTDPV